MPESFIFALILFIVAILAAGAAFLIKEKGGAVTVAVLALLFGLGFTVNAAFNHVPVRNVGIVTEWSKPTGETTGAGVHWVKPWQKVEEWDANYELWSHVNSNPTEHYKNGRGLQVKIAGGQDAWVPVSVEYAPLASQAAQDFQDYARNRDNWIARRVDPTLTAAVTNLFREHDPLAKANVDQATGQVNPPDMAPYKAELNERLKSEITGFNVRNLYIGTIVYSDETTKALQKYAGLVLEKRNLEQERVNQEVKNQITAKQATVDERTYCLQIADRHGRDPGLCFLNGNTPVIVGSAPQK